MALKWLTYWIKILVVFGIFPYHIITFGAKHPIILHWYQHIDIRTAIHFCRFSIDIYWNYRHTIYCSESLSILSTFCSTIKQHCHNPSDSSLRQIIMNLWASSIIVSSSLLKCVVDAILLIIFAYFLVLLIARTAVSYSLSQFSGLWQFAYVIAYFGIPQTNK